MTQIRKLWTSALALVFAAIYAVGERAVQMLEGTMYRLGLVHYVVGPVTILEASKDVRDPLRRAFIELYSGSSRVLQVLPFQQAPGGVMEYDVEGSLPGVAFRGYNEAYVASYGILNPKAEFTKIAGGDIDVDVAIVKNKGPAARSRQERMKVRALALAWTRKFFKGDSSSEPREFDGLQTRVSGSQIIPAGSTSGGDPLSMYLLDRAIAQTMNPTHIFADVNIGTRISQAARAGLGGVWNTTTDTFGRQVNQYNGLPIETVDLDDQGAKILGFTEAGPGGGTTSASIYVVSLTEDGVQGIQNGGIDVRDLGEVPDKPVFRTRIEWLNGLAVFNGRAVTRIWGIKDAAFVA